MKMPRGLRIDLIIAILRGLMNEVTYYNGLYRFEIPAAGLTRWRKWNERRRKGSTRGHR